MFRLPTLRKAHSSSIENTKKIEGKSEENDYFMTEAAIDILENRGGHVYLEQMTKMFINIPSLIGDVSPKYQRALEDKLKCLR